MYCSFGHRPETTDHPPADGVFFINKKKFLKKRDTLNQQGPIKLRTQIETERHPILSSHSFQFETYQHNFKPTVLKSLIEALVVHSSIDIATSTTVYLWIIKMTHAFILSNTDAFINIHNNFCRQKQ